MKKVIEDAWEGFSPAEALWQTWSIVREGNRYIDEQKPWSLAKKPEDRAALQGVLGRLLETLRWAALMVAPAMPSASREILRQLGREQDEGPGRPDGAGRAAPSPSRSRCSRASSPNARRR